MDYDNAIALFKRKNVAYTEMTSEQTQVYMRDWISQFVPADKYQKALDIHCFSSDDICGYLWHVFSFEILMSLSGAEADEAYRNVKRVDCILFLSCDEIAFKVSMGSLIDIEDLAVLYDVLLTDADFRWTYTKTHEIQCGPYFYSKSL